MSERGPDGKLLPGHKKLPGAGRPKDIGVFRELCQSHTKEAVDALVFALGDPDHMVAAAKVLLENAWGRPSQAIELSGDATVRIAKELRSDAELEALIDAERAKVAE